MQARGSWTPIRRLTRSVDNNAQVIISPGWWPNSVSAPTYFRTNQTNASMVVRVRKTRKFGIKLGGAAYTALNASGAAMYVNPPTFAARWARTQKGLLSARWTYGLRPITGSTGKIFFKNLNPAADSYVQIMTTRRAWSMQGTPAFECMRQKTDAGVTEAGEFGDVLGFITDPLVEFRKITWTLTRKKFILYADSYADARVTPTTGIKTELVNEPRYALVGGTQATDTWDYRGVLVGYPWKLIETYAIANNIWPVVMNISFGGSWQAVMGPNLRAYHAVVWPGIFLDIKDRFKFRTNLVNTDFTAAGDWTGGWTPQVILLGSTTNDCVQCAIEDVAAPAENFFDGNTLRDNIGRDDGAPESTVHAILTQFPSAKIFLWSSYYNDGKANFSGAGSTPKLSTEAGLAANTAGFYGFAAGQTEYVAGTGRYVDPVDGAGTTLINPDDATPIFAPLHFNAATYELIRSYLQSDFNVVAAAG